MAKPSSFDPVKKLNGHLNDETYFLRNKEGGFQKDIKTILKLFGLYVLKLPASDMEKQDFSPDLMCMFKRQLGKANPYFFIEVKRMKKSKGKWSSTKTRKNQDVTNARIEKYTDVHVISNWQEFKDLLIGLELI